MIHPWYLLTLNEGDMITVDHCARKHHLFHYMIFLTLFLKQKESTVKKHNYTSWKGETKTNSEVNNEERIYEERLVKACTMGQLKVIQEYLERKRYMHKADSTMSQ